MRLVPVNLPFRNPCNKNIFEHWCDFNKIIFENIFGFYDIFCILSSIIIDLFTVHFFNMGELKMILGYQELLSLSKLTKRKTCSKFSI